MHLINKMCLDRWDGKLYSRYGLYSIEDCDKQMAQITSLEVLHSFLPSGFPQYDLKLKLNAPVNSIIQIMFIYFDFFIKHK